MAQTLQRTGKTGDRGMRVSSPEDLNGAPQVEHKEDNGPVLHLLQTTEDHKQNHVPASHLQHCGVCQR